MTHYCLTRLEPIILSSDLKINKMKNHFQNIMTLQLYTKILILVMTFSVFQLHFHSESSLNQNYIFQIIWTMHYILKYDLHPFLLL